LQIESLQPLILLGMHRSGTSLAVRLLGEMGLETGRWLSRDSEAVYFQRLNRRILSSVGASWTEVDPFVQAARSPEFVSAQVKRTRRDLTPGLPIPFFNPGLVDFFEREQRPAFLAGTPPTWAWKDPRTTLTFPVWVQIFPQARWLYIVRNGIDVAISLHQRALRQNKKLRNHLIRFDFHPHTLDFDFCFRLWEAYVQFVLDFQHLIPADRLLQIRYEDLLADPRLCLQDIADFVEFPVSPENFERACSRVNRSRLDNTSLANNYRDSIPRLAASPWMRRLGYTYD